MRITIETDGRVDVSPGPQDAARGSGDEQSEAADAGPPPAELVEEIEAASAAQEGDSATDAGAPDAA